MFTSVRLYVFFIFLAFLPSLIASDFEIEVETGQVWQTLNDVQIPNTTQGSRFSLVDAVGLGPLPATRVYVTWNMDAKHSFRALYAPLSYTLTGSFDTSIDFAGQTYAAGSVDATYTFNSYRLSYRYCYMDEEDLKLWVGFTAKIRDAKIALSQASTTSESTDLGFVPLLHLGAQWYFSDHWYGIFDFDGLAGGPGRAFDVALKLAYTITDDFSLSGGYRTVEGGADVASVYSFAWLHYAVVAGTYRF